MTDAEAQIKALTGQLEEARKAQRDAEMRTAHLRRLNADLAGVNDVLESTLASRSAELADAADRAQQANRAKSMFLANMSHEFRTPLNAIIGYTELLAEEAAEMELAEFSDDLGRIHTAARHLADLINDVLDLSKIEAGKAELDLSTFAVESVLETLVANVRPLMAQAETEFVVTVEESVGQMHSDVTKLKQCVINLLSNAAKFTRRGKVELAVCNAFHHHQPGLSFTVKDTGIGIERAKLSLLFSPFTQADATTTRKYGGTGLGLAITARYCELLGGAVSVDSEVGVGSEFTLWLPRCTSD